MSPLVKELSMSLKRFMFIQGAPWDFLGLKSLEVAKQLSCMIAIDMILLSIQRIELFSAYVAFETIEVPKLAFGDVHVSDACME